MTDTQLYEAVATLLRAYATAPLKDLEVHLWDQAGYEDPHGRAIVGPPEGEWTTEDSIGIGPHTGAGYTLSEVTPVGVHLAIPFIDSAANRQSIELAVWQVRSVFRQNRNLTAGSQIAKHTANVRWKYGLIGERGSEGFMKAATVVATYLKPTTAAS